MTVKNRRRNIIIAAIIWLVIGLSTMILLTITRLQQEDTTIQLIGKNIYVVVFLTILWFYMLHFKSTVLLSIKQLSLFGIVYLLVMIPAILLMETDFVYMVPFTMFGMIVALMMDEVLGIMANIVIVIILGIVGDMSITFVLFFMVSGTVAPILSLYAKERQNMVYVALYMITIHAVLSIVNGFIQSETGIFISIPVLFYTLIHGAMAVVLTYGSLPVWETVFGIVTPFKLQELCNTNQKLLLKLMEKAPGTFHHSQMVSSLSEAAAAEIGGNVLLAKCGALYHDIGKIKRPEYFIENQNGENPHDEIAPDASALILKNHVTEGLKLAKEYHLPKSIIEIIEQHHGDTLIQYFYKKAVDHSDGFDIPKEEFTYNGQRPQSRESAIVMIADSVEAAVRAKELTDIDEIRVLIQEIAQGKISEEQMSDCDLKLKDLKDIEKAFIKVYNGMYHERVKYPKG